MTYLVDANVLSEPTKPQPAPAVVEWLRANERILVVDPIILGELRIGVLSLPAGRKRARLSRWFDLLSRTIVCVPWETAVALRWAQLVVDLKRKGLHMPIIDSMIAATALEHDLTIATRNARHFKMTGAKVLNPFS